MTKERVSEVELQTIPSSEKISLQKYLGNTVGELRELIAAETNSPLFISNVNDVPTPSANNSVEYPSLEILNNVLSITQQPSLLSDQKFGLFSSVVNGEEPSNKTNSFAADLSDYISRPEFNCKKPLIARYFNERYRQTNSPARCHNEVPFYIMTRHDGTKLVWLDPMRIRSIHLLFSGIGQGAASRFGHVALRLVVCPDATSTDVDCNLNLSEHLVLGFGAHINDLELDTFKALKGGYKAYLFTSRFMDSYKEYAIGEFREMYSLPLIISIERREQMVRELSQIHWSYSEEYHFFSKNCTTLLQQALTALWPEFAEYKKMQNIYIRPDSFFEAIKESPLAESEKLRSLEIAEREGNYFSSTKLFYEQAVNAVKMAMSNPQFKDVETYLHASPASRKNSIAADNEFVLRLSKDNHLLEAQLMLEDLAVMRSEQQLMLAIARYFHDKLSSNFSGVLDQLNPEQKYAFENCLLAPVNLLAKPILRQDGIPNKDNIPAPVNILATCRTQGQLKHLTSALELVGKTDPKNWNRIIELSQYFGECIENVMFLKERQFISRQPSRVGNAALLSTLQ